MQNETDKKQSARSLFYRRCSHPFRNRQHGSLLVGLIITMVILGVLSVGLVYIFSTSTMNPVSANHSQRAYYNAEAGFRYLTSLYRATSDKTLFTTYATSQTLLLPDGGKAVVTVTVPPTTTATATAAVSGSSLVLSAITGTFPSAPGFFTKEGSVTVYRYTGITGTTLTGIYPAGITDGKITSKEQTRISSKGTFGSVSRTVTYTWPLSGEGSVPLKAGAGYAMSPVNSADWNMSGSKADVVANASYPTPNDPTKTWHSTDMYAQGYYGNTTVRYLFIPFKHLTAGVDLATARSNNGTNLSYEVQTKVSMTPDVLQYGAGGIAFRVAQLSTYDYKGYVVSFMRVTNGTSPKDYVPSGVRPVDASNSTINNKLLMVLWEQTTGYTSGKWLAYKVLNSATASNVTGDFDNYVRGRQYSGDGFFIHDETSMVVRVVEKDADAGGKTNDIQVFFGDAWHDNATYARVQNSNPYDVQNLRYVYEPALGDGNNLFPVKWPSLPGVLAWTAAENDWFTAIVWDRINPAVTTASLLADDRGSNTIIRNNIHTTAGASYANEGARPEIALHTFGSLSLTGNAVVYFNDFAIRLLSGGGGGGGNTYIPPIQQ